jgi:hypothetical protein
MKDLDFDELDRAVNSLIGGTSVHATEPDEPAAIDITSAVQNSHVAPVAAFVPQPVVAAEPVVAPVAPAATQPPTQPLAARRSSGRFMDVVHPSSDMRTSASQSTGPMSRVGVSITPTAAVAQPTPAPVIAPPQVVSTEWPDPLDFQGYTDTPVAPAADPVAVVSTTPAVIDEPVVTQPDPESVGPLESPFLTDTKVEKRPLGAFSDEQTVAAPVVNIPPAEPVGVQPITSDADVDIIEVKDVEPVAIDSPDAQTGPIEAPLPAELGDDLLTVESDQDTSNHPPEPVAVTPAPDPVAVGATSITQQYTESASTGDQPTGAIFDTHAYKKPLAHPKKKKSGWLMVLWIFVLLVIGAGVGAAVYFYVLPQL